MMSSLNYQYYMPLLCERIQMLIKYCEACQMNSLWKIGKCPHEMQPIPIEGKVWSQIGNYNKIFYKPFLYNLNGKCKL